MIEMTKIEFVTCLNFIKRKHNQDIAFVRALEEVSDGYYYDCSFYEEYEMMLSSLLSKLMNDTHGWIDYWIYECHYGDTFSIGDVIAADGTKPDLTTPEQLYDFLTNEVSHESKRIY